MPCLGPDTYGDERAAAAWWVCRRIEQDAATPKAKGAAKTAAATTAGPVAVMEDVEEFEHLASGAHTLIIRCCPP